ncbi:uveal autoantigen with coiled-coil domains and ankyrin repeats-like isoform X2 [Saccostrea echinata]|uniref:uveal autoantigen with coiled-coil domains and ankyrin repeats-like isoform X2 n=1 Tax=Saccostrea echinata TaxID=191078 RepID=UPI002A800EF0|nr:uveal autoantigen with coiled-coil domains and ankyrin repeats-like isoform X2 [Saccostrea echinata]
METSQKHPDDAQDFLSQLMNAEEKCSTLEDIDPNKIRNDRHERNLQTMMAADSEIAKKMFPQDFCKPNSQTEKAAVTIQKYARGYLGRKKYVELLCDQFEKDQSIMQLKIKEQVEEGELLVENHRLEVLLDDNLTRRRNKSRQYITDIITIQRAWRSYLRRKNRDHEDDTKKDNSTEKGKQHLPEAVQQTLTTVEESDSMSSSYSEVSLADSRQFRHVESGRTENNPNIVQNPGESEEDFNRRRRKVNYLSLAQEFAELQRTNSDFVAPENGQTEGVSVGCKNICDENSGGEDSRNKAQSKQEVKSRSNFNSGETEDFEVYNMDTALPSFDWEDLEQKLQQATQTSNKMAQRNDREAIRKKLAMDAGVDDDCNTQKFYKKPSVTKSSNTNLQICFMNEEQEMADPPSHQLNPQETQNGREHGREKKKDGDFLVQQAKLQQEVKIALVQAGTMAHMQLEVEKQIKKKSPSADSVKVSFLESIHQSRVGKQDLFVMNLGQLQVLVNDLHTQIENLNEELMNLLMERDELHMSQDSMLVDIEDLTRRAEETAKKH